MSELAEGKPGVRAWLIDNALVPRYGFQPTPDGGGNIVDFEGEVFAVIAPEDFMVTQWLGFNKDNTSIFMLDSRERDTAALTRVSLENGERDAIAISDDADISAVLTDQRKSSRSPTMSTTSSLRGTDLLTRQERTSRRFRRSSLDR